MKGSQTVSISSYLQTLRAFRFFSKSKFYWLPLCFATPVLIGSSAVVSFAAPAEIAQVVGSGSINRPTLKVGSQGERVSELQGALKLLGYYTGAVDGNFNETTANAVSKFKQAAGLTPDSIVDTVTWQKLFPGEATVASSPSSPSSPNTAPKFPTPSQTPNATRVVNPTPEPKPASPKPATTTTSQTTVRQSSPDSGTSTSRSEQTLRTTSTNSAGQTSRSEQTIRTTSTTGSGETVRTTSTTDSGETVRTRQTSSSGQTSRTRQTSSSGQTTRQTPAIQYTAAGMPILRVGMRGSEVVKLQERLKRLGFLDGDADGDFGASTEAAVKAAQQRYGLEADGVAGGATWDVLMRRRSQQRNSG